MCVQFIFYPESESGSVKKSHVWPVQVLRRAVASLGPDLGRSRTAPLQRREHPPHRSAASPPANSAQGASCAPPVWKTARRGEIGVGSNAKSS